MAENHHSKGNEVTSISSDIEFSGDLEFDRELEILGSFEGRINTKGSILIRPNAIVKADISTGLISIEGQLQGTVKDANFVHIQGSGRVKADIHCKEIQIDRKAHIHGVILMEST